MVAIASRITPESALLRIAVMDSQIVEQTLDQPIFCITEIATGLFLEDSNNINQLPGRLEVDLSGWRVVWSILAVDNAQVDHRGRGE